MTFDISKFNVVKEGKATILAPLQDKVFYNHIQQFNRDLSVMAINAWLVQYKSSKEGTRELRVKRRKLAETLDMTTTEVGAATTGPMGSTETSEPGNTETRTTTTADNPQETEANPKETEANYTETPDEAQRLEPSIGTKRVSPDVPFMRILEALSATGLRAIRYGHEIPQVSRIIANDLLPEAVESIERSVRYNNLQHVVQGHQGDAIKYMGLVSEKEKFHIVDIDPYGTAAPFIEQAILLVRDNGMLLVTCTDAGVLAGSGYPEKCFALYGGNNFGNTHMGLESNHEAGIRLILGTIALAAARHKKAIEPLLSLSIDYYFRVFVRVTTRPVEVKKLALTMALPFHCVGCGDIIDQRLGRISDNKHQTPRLAQVGSGKCKYCELPFHVAGPMWGGSLHKHEFIDEILRFNGTALAETYGTRERIKGMLTLARNELSEPFYFNLNALSSYMKAPPISIDEFARAVGNLGYEVSLTHAKKNCVKTSAPWEKVLQIFVAWLRRSNEKLVKEIQEQLAQVQDEQRREKLHAKVEALEANMAHNPKLSAGMVGFKILKNVQEDAQVDFDTDNEQSIKMVRLRRLKMVRFQENPTKNWGPKARPLNK